jgi:hypothetical protein
VAGRVEVCVGGAGARVCSADVVLSAEARTALETTLDVFPLEHGFCRLLGLRGNLYASQKSMRTLVNITEVPPSPLRPTSPIIRHGLFLSHVRRTCFLFGLQTVPDKKCLCAEAVEDVLEETGWLPKTIRRCTVVF